MAQTVKRLPTMLETRVQSLGWEDLIEKCVEISISYLFAAAAAAKSLQSCPTLCDPMDYSLPSFSVHRIL